MAGKGSNAAATAKRAQKATDNFVAEVVEIESLHPHPRNYREHPEDQIAHLVESVREFGVYRNVVAAKDGTILAGHGIVQAAKQAGLMRIPIVRLKLAPDDPAALKLLVADNEVEHLAEQNDRMLAELLKKIKDDAPGSLLGTGFDDKMLANFLMITRPSNEIADFDAAAHWVGMPDFETAKRAFAFVTVSFGSEDDLAEFNRKLGTELKVGTRSMWYPPRPREDSKNVRFEKQNG